MADFRVEVMKDWTSFKTRQTKYLSYTRAMRAQFIFRGQASNSWRLEPTIDRLSGANNLDDLARSTLRLKLIDEFRYACIGLRSSEEHPSDEAEWEFLGRHHGLPTTILDWTQSPFVGAFFAFHEPSDTEFVSVWVLQLAHAEIKTISQLAIDPPETILRFNIRATEQRGVSMRVLAKTPTIEDLLGRSLIRLDIPTRERSRALAELDEMLINARTLYRDLDGAAQLATFRAMES